MSVPRSSSTSTVGNDQYESAAESITSVSNNENNSHINNGSTSKTRQQPQHLHEKQNSYSADSSTIAKDGSTLGKETHQSETSDDDDESLHVIQDEYAVQQQLTRTKTTPQLYDEEFDTELDRVVTQMSKITHRTTHIEEDEENVQNPRLMDWDSPDDPENPLNWPSWKKWFCTMSVAFLCLVICLGSSIYVCAIPEMMVKWNISQTLGLSGLTFYLIGLAFGPVVAAPLSELFGRKVVYCGSLPISMLFIMGVGLSKHIRETLVLRFFAGLTASGALAVGGGTVSDIWAPKDIGYEHCWWFKMDYVDQLILCRCCFHSYLCYA
ncbi:unnamed protein product [Ambrosiozyma monospora]|uniref:Unnamed protein product n=1 Tax=Ambrosiozyma monospora TaxID=43982 RepID=A0A9W6YYI0_AMBMO|nr:unnamed protein product [Ambrosiozyma monospora]